MYLTGEGDSMNTGSREHDRAFTFFLFTWRDNSKHSSFALMLGSISTLSFVRTSDPSPNPKSPKSGLTLNISFPMFSSFFLDSSVTVQRYKSPLMDLQLNFSRTVYDVILIDDEFGTSYLSERPENSGKPLINDV